MRRVGLLVVVRYGHGDGAPGRRSGSSTVQKDERVPKWLKVARERDGNGTSKRNVETDSLSPVCPAASQTRKRHVRTPRPRKFLGSANQPSSWGWAAGCGCDMVWSRVTGHPICRLVGGWEGGSEQGQTN